jgi:hypothetical protein
VSKYAARNCIQSLLNVQDKERELYKVTRRSVKEHCGNGGKHYFDNELFKEKRPVWVIADEVKALEEMKRHVELQRIESSRTSTSSAQ